MEAYIESLKKNSPLPHKQAKEKVKKRVDIMGKDKLACWNKVLKIYNGSSYILYLHDMPNTPQSRIYYYS